MISYSSFELANGLKVFVHEDNTSPLAVVNILYNVGSRDEHPEKTGFAHLFEHLMFGGSANVPAFDTPLQRVGGENNAFTSPDITNYYVTLPVANLETAFWLESDRMMALSFDPKVLEVQRKVVIEEFKQRYLNQPYGDVWLKLRPLAYSIHPYSWATIGKEIAHIEEATMQDVKDFFYKYYLPNNAIMVVGGNVKTDEIKTLAEKWFGGIKPGPGEKYIRKLPKEPVQTKKRTLEIKANVPLNAIYKAYHMDKRMGKDFYATDLLSDLLGRGQSSRLYQKLVRDKKIFNSISAYCMGSIDEGLFVVDGKLNDGITFKKAEDAINEVILHLQTDILEIELQKVKNQAEASLVMSEIELLNRCMNIAFAANMGDVEMINKEAALIQNVSEADIKRAAKTIFTEENSSVLYYGKSEK
ncbi:MAG: insulinase family protein [Bacteroidetes bacterium]|nr:MAG: insulinase family protein [Bacteroidota bacterium]